MIKPLRTTMLLIVALAALSLMATGCDLLLDLIGGGGVTQVLDKPSKVKNLEAIAGKGKVVLTWDKNDADELVESYNIYRTDDPDNASVVDYEKIDSTDDTEYTDTDVVNGVTYGYYVRAENDAGEGDRPDADEIVTAKPSQTITDTGEVPTEGEVGTVTGTVTNTSGKTGKILVAVIVFGEEEPFDFTTAKATDGTYTLSAPADTYFFVVSIVDSNGNLSPDEGEAIGFNDNEGEGFIISADETITVDIEITGQITFTESGTNIIGGFVYNYTSLTGPVVILLEGGIQPEKLTTISLGPDETTGYTFNQVPDGNYRISAFLDINGNGFQDSATMGNTVIPEPSYFDDNFGQGYDLFGGTELLDIDIYLEEFRADNKLFVTIHYSGPTEDRNRIQVGLKPTDPTKPLLQPFVFDMAKLRTEGRVTETPQDITVNLEIVGPPPGEYFVGAQMDVNKDGRFDDRDAGGVAQDLTGAPAKIVIDPSYSPFVYIELRKPAPSVIDVPPATGTGSIAGVVKDSKGTPDVGDDIPLARIRVHLHSDGLNLVSTSDDIDADVLTDANGNYGFNKIVNGEYVVNVEGHSLQFEGKVYENAAYRHIVAGAAITQPFTLLRVDPNFRNLTGFFKKVNDPIPPATTTTTAPFEPFDRARLFLIRKDTGAGVARVAPGQFTLAGVFYNGFDGSYGIGELAGGTYTVRAEGDGFIPFNGEITINPTGPDGVLNVSLDRYRIILSSLLSTSASPGPTASPAPTASPNTTTITWTPVSTTGATYWNVGRYVVAISEATLVATPGVTSDPKFRLVKEYTPTQAGPTVKDASGNDTYIKTFTDADFGTTPPATGTPLFWVVVAIMGDGSIIGTPTTTNPSGLKLDEIPLRLVGVTFNPDPTLRPPANVFIPFRAKDNILYKSGIPTAAPTGPPTGIASITVTVTPSSGTLTATQPTFQPTISWTAVTGANSYELVIDGPPPPPTSTVPNPTPFHFSVPFIPSTQTSFAYPPPPAPGLVSPPLNYAGTFKARVVARDATGLIVAQGEKDFVITKQ